MAWSDRRAFLEARALRHDLGLTPQDRADPFDIAAQRGIEIVHLEVGEGDPVEGAFLRRDGHDFILVNSSKAGRRQRFTCAHELGHAVLLESTQDAEFLDTDEQLDQARAGTADEREANLFAAELLMPEAGIKELIRDIHDPEDAAGAIVRSYNVSPRSAAIRLSEVADLDKGTTTSLLETIDTDWRAFWRIQQIPKDSKPDTGGGLPKRFRQRANRLLEAGVISQERHVELLNRPLRSQA